MRVNGILSLFSLCDVCSADCRSIQLLLCFLIVAIHYSEISIPLSLLLLLGQSLM